MSTARHIPPPLAGEGTGGRNDRAREGVIPRPHLWGRGLRAKQAGGGGKSLQDVHGQAYPTPACGGRDGREERPSEGGGQFPAPTCGGGGCERSKQGEGEFSCRLSTARHIIYFSLNNDGSVIPFCSFPNIKSHMKFLA